MRQFAAVWLLGTTLFAAGAGAQGFVWHGDRIRAEVRKGTDVPGAGQFLVLTQELAADELGWTMLKIALPASFKVAKVVVASGKVRLETAADGSFELTAENVPELNFAILDGGPKPEAELVRLWSEHARVSE